MKARNPVVQLSQEFVYAAKSGDSVNAFEEKLAGLSFDSLKAALITDNEKKAFWINLYNAFTQTALQNNAGQYSNRREFFKQTRFHVAGKIFSLDDIEHGFLRRSKIKWSLGKLNKLFTSETERALRVAKLDYRIHFTLNCGAKSCPPIAFYDDQKLDAQLETATKLYLRSEAEYDSVSDIILLPKILSWFRGDFGGKKGILRILKARGIIPATAKPKLKFKDYDWNLFLNNYSTETL